MDDLLEGLLEPFAEAFVGMFLDGASSIGNNGWTEGKCKVQTLLDNVWWNAGEPRN